MKSLDDEITKIERLIIKEWNRRTPEKNGGKRNVNIYCWEVPKAGLRVSEVSMTTTYKSGHPCKMSGCSFMQSDTEAVPFLVERLALEREHFDNKDDEKDLIWRLHDAIFGTEPK